MRGVPGPFLSLRELPQLFRSAFRLGREFSKPSALILADYGRVKIALLWRAKIAHSGAR